VDRRQRVVRQPEARQRAVRQPEARQRVVRQPVVRPDLPELIAARDSAAMQKRRNTGFM
jgi:hypothetical protein